MQTNTLTYLPYHTRAKACALIDTQLPTPAAISTHEHSLGGWSACA
jgi:hypothetical protein